MDTQEGQTMTPPTFPDFRPIQSCERSLFERYSIMDELYSDFNFTSVYLWDLNGSHKYSIHNNNLILQLDHYVTGKPLLSVLGKHNIERTIDIVLQYCEKQFADEQLQLVPEQTIKAIADTSMFSIQEDRDNFDYVYSLELLADLSGNTYKSKRHAANRCQRDYDITFKELNEITDTIRTSISTLIEKWRTEKIKNGKEHEDSDSELRSVQRVFDDFNGNPAIKLNTVSCSNELVGFSIDELEDNGYVLSHYCKTMPTVKGLSECFNRHLAESFLNRGYTYWNWEQDTGNEKLERLKLSYRPIHFNKKFTLSRHTTRDR